ncbi:HRH1 protein, partial [Amia calva]|nr:HRH1 protein [Amia calva]
MSQSGSRVDQGRQVLMGLLLGWLCLVTILMNLMVLYAVQKTRTLHTVGNLYIVSLAAADLLIGCAVMPLSLDYLLTQEWRMGFVACKFWLSVDYVASTASIFSLFILCLDRYNSIQQPLAYMQIRTKARASWLIALAWLLSASWLIPILCWPVGEVPPDPLQCDTEFRHSSWFKLLAAFLNFYLPSGLMLKYYYRIYAVVRGRFRRRFGFVGDGFLEMTGPFLLGRWEKKSRAPDTFRMQGWPETQCVNLCLSRKLGGRGRPQASGGVEQKLAEHKEGAGDLDGLSEFSQFSHPCPVTIRYPSGYARLLSMDSKPAGRPRSLSADDSRATPHPASVGGRRCKRTQRLPHRATSCRVMSRAGAGAAQNFQEIRKLRRMCEILGSGGPGHGQGRASWMRPSISAQPPPTSQLKKEWKAAKQLGAIMVVFLVCWIPYFTAFTITALCNSCVSPQTHMVTIWLGYLNSTLNPFIYPFCNTTFRKTFRHILRLQR